MLRKTITYKDYNGKECKEDFYFNLNKAEVTEMELSKQGGLSTYLRAIVDANDQPTMVQTFKEIILKSYGEKSEDGKRFKKSEEISTAFMQTEAYNELFMELLTNADAAIAFMNGITPEVQ